MKKRSNFTSLILYTYTGHCLFLQYHARRLQVPQVPEMLCVIHPLYIDFLCKVAAESCQINK